MFTEKGIEEFTVGIMEALFKNYEQNTDGNVCNIADHASLAYVLWKRVLNYNPLNPNWFNRDRVILCNSQAFFSRYAPLFLNGYDLCLENVKNFWETEDKYLNIKHHFTLSDIASRDGGIVRAFKSAIAEARLNAMYNRERFNVIDHHTYVLASDDEMTKDISLEVAAMAGRMKLHKFIIVYVEGKKEHLNITERFDLHKKFEERLWFVQTLQESMININKITEAFQLAKKEISRPSIIMIRPNTDSKAIPKNNRNDYENKSCNALYFIPHFVIEHLNECASRGTKLEADWEKKFEEFKCEFPDLGKQLKRVINQRAY